jgi:glyoxylase-like metal-dependent hydrolase (beta-lactamase superfamily II)
MTISPMASRWPVILPKLVRATSDWRLDTGGITAGIDKKSGDEEELFVCADAIEFNRPGVEQQLPEYIRNLEARVTAGEAANPQPSNLRTLKQALADARFFLAQKQAVRLTIPDTAFTNRLTLQPGAREVQVRHHDRAVTPGDAFLYLPAEKILITGDLLVNPIAFALSSYPTTWLATLEHLDSLDASIIVPGHGAPLRNEALLHRHIEAFQIMLREGKAENPQGGSRRAENGDVPPRWEFVDDR